MAMKAVLRQSYFTALVMFAAVFERVDWKTIIMHTFFNLTTTIISTLPPLLTSATRWTPLTPPKTWISALHNCLAASNSHAVMKSDDSLVQQGWPFHKGGDMRVRSPWLNGTPLSDCQSSDCHRVACHLAANIMQGRWGKWTFHSLCAALLEQLPDLSRRKVIWNVWIFNG